MSFENMPNLLMELLGACFQIFDDPPAPYIFPSFFLFFFFIPTYMVLLGARSAFIEFRGWLLPTTARRLAEGVNRISTLLLAGFLPGWMTTIALYVWWPQYTPEQGVMAGFAVVVCFAVLYNLLLVRNVPGLADALGRGFWHAVPMGGFFLCLYLGIFLYSAEALLAAFTFLFSPFGVVTILPFAASSWNSSRTEGGPTCTLCGEAASLAPIRCARCEASYHAECWDYSEGCARKPCRSGNGGPLALG